MNKNLSKLLNGVEYKLLNGSGLDFDIEKVVYDSKEVKKNDLFVCLTGARFDSHTIINDIISSGAKAIVVDIALSLYYKNIKDVILIQVENTRNALAIISKNYFEAPNEKMKIIGITGTKGKTTTAFMIRNLLTANGHKVGMVGTIGIFYDDKHIITENTTPESFILYKSFYEMAKAGCDYVVMEVSSQSLKYHRVDGIIFDYAIFTNISLEHIGENEHTDFEDYFSSKLKIFSVCKKAIINGETDYIDRIIDTCKKYGVTYYTMDKTYDMNLSIPGDYNIKNASLAYRFAEVIDLAYSNTEKAIMETKVPGRCEVVYKDKHFMVVVDFSYEPTGAKRFLETISKIPHKRIVTLFGCGGNRSKDRRFGMGEVTGQNADFVILTADNSRYEKTLDIIADIETTLTKYKTKNKNYVVIENRKDAIEYAIKNRKDGDIICVMGKGHEPTMETNGAKVHFLDSEEVQKAIEKYV